MALAYLLFDSSDEDSGHCSFEAMASVLPDRLPALLGEVEAVLRWARRSFGAPSAEGGEWDFDLQATGADGQPLEIEHDAGRGHLALPTAVHGRVTLAFTLGGSSGFAAAFREAFPESD